MKVKDIISDRQFGFHEKNSTEDATAFLITKIHDALDKQSAMCLFLNLTKTFGAHNFFGYNNSNNNNNEFLYLRMGNVY